MTYCVALNLVEGLLLASDTRTSAGVDHLATFRKMHVFEQRGRAVIVLMSAGNLATTQSVISLLRQQVDDHGQPMLLQCRSLYEAAERVGSMLRQVIARDAGPSAGGVDFGSSFLVAGQIAGEGPRLFNVYPQGNFIESAAETPYFQIGEVKYGKPILDRVITHVTPLRDAAKCALISFDSTIRSNLSVGLPIDMVIYRRDSLQVDTQLRFTENDPYFQMIRQGWSQGLRDTFARLPDPDWAGR